MISLKSLQYTLVRFSGLFLLSLLCACAAPSVTRLPQALPSPELLLEKLEAQSARFHSLRGLAKVSFNRNGEKRSARHVILAEYPDKLRLETLGLFGAPALLLASNGDEVTALLPGESLAYTGPAESAFLQRLTRLPLADSDIVAILLQRPPLISRLQQRAELGPQGGVSLVLSAGAREQKIEFDQALRPVSFTDSFDGETLALVRYGDLDFKGQAHLFSVQLPQLDIEAVLSFSEIENNVEHKVGIFNLKPPAGYRVEPLPAY